MRRRWQVSLLLLGRIELVRVVRTRCTRRILHLMHRVVALARLGGLLRLMLMLLQVSGSLMVGRGRSCGCRRKCNGVLLMMQRIVLQVYTCC